MAGLSDLGSMGMLGSIGSLGSLGSMGGGYSMQPLMDPLEEQRKKMKLESSLMQWPSPLTVQQQQQQQQMLLRVQQMQAMGIGGQTMSPSPLIRPNPFPLDSQTSSAFTQTPSIPLHPAPLPSVQGGPSLQQGLGFYQSGPFSEGMTGSFSFQSVMPSMMGGVWARSGVDAIGTVGVAECRYFPGRDSPSSTVTPMRRR